MTERTSEYASLFARLRAHRETLSATLKAMDPMAVRTTPVSTALGLRIADTMQDAVVLLDTIAERLKSGYDGGDLAGMPDAVTESLVDEMAHAGWDMDPPDEPGPSRFDERVAR